MATSVAAAKIWKTSPTLIAPYLAWPWGSSENRAAICFWPTCAFQASFICEGAAVANLGFSVESDGPSTVVVLFSSLLLYSVACRDPRGKLPRLSTGHLFCETPD